MGRSVFITIDEHQSSCNNADKIKKEYGDLKKDMDKANSGVNESIEKILPASENFTDLARDLDKYFLNTSTGAAPMFLSDLRFNAARVGAEEFASATLPTVLPPIKEEGTENI
jgi:hypothetical protein